MTPFQLWLLRPRIPPRILWRHVHDMLGREKSDDDMYTIVSMGGTILGTIAVATIDATEKENLERVLLKKIATKWSNLVHMLVCRDDRQIVIAGVQPPNHLGTESTFTNKCIVATSPDGARLACSDTTHNVHLWNVQTGEVVSTLPGTPFSNGGRVVSLDFSPDNKLLLVAFVSGYVAVLHAHAGYIIRARRVTGGYDINIYDAAFSSNGEFALLNIWGDVAVYNARSCTLRGRDARSYFPNAITLACSSNGMRRAVGATKYVHTCDADYIYKYGVPCENPCVAYSPCGKWLAVGGKRFFTVWDMDDGKVDWDGKTTHCIKSIAFSSDSSMVVRSSPKSIFWYDVKTGELLKSIRTEGAYSIACLPGGRVAYPCSTGVKIISFQPCSITDFELEHK